MTEPKTPTHCSKPMLRSETKKGHPWWCSQCGEYLERDAPIVTSCRTDDGGTVLPTIVWDGLRFPDSRITADKLAPIYMRNDESVEELKKRIIERLEQRSIHGNLITRMSSSGRLHEFSTVETKTPYTVMAAHYDMTDDEIREAECDLPLGRRYIWARVSKEDFGAL